MKRALTIVAIGLAGYFICVYPADVAAVLGAIVKGISDGARKFADSLNKFIHAFGTSGSPGKSGIPAQ